jgi:hypothetical protein
MEKLYNNFISLERYCNLICSEGININQIILDVTLKELL